MSAEETLAEWEELKVKGNNAFKDRQFNDAISFYSDAIEKNGNEAVLFSNRSACYLETGDNTAAERDALRAVEIDSSFVRGYNRLHTALCNLGRFKEAAIRAKKGAVAVSASAPPSDVRQLQSKAILAEKVDEALQRFDELFQAGNLESAADQLRDALKSFPNSHHVVFPFVEASANKNQDEAYKLLSEVKKSSATETDLNYLYGLVYYYRGQDGFAKAQTVLRETLGWDPDHAKAKILLKRLRQIETHKEAGNTAFKEKNNSVAIQEYTTAIEIDPTNVKMVATLRGNRGAARMAQKDFQGALLDCNFAINNGVSTGKMFARRSRIKAELEQMEDSLRDMQRAADLDRSFSAELRQLEVKCRTAKRKNYYKALELSRNESDPKTIKKAYMKLCLKWHPDKWCDSTDEEKEIAEVQFKELTEAYEVLSDPQKKYRYDNGLDDNAMGGGGSSPFHSARGNPYGAYASQGSPFSFFGPMGDRTFSFSGQGQRQRGGGRYTDPQFNSGGFFF